MSIKAKKSHAPFLNKRFSEKLYSGIALKVLHQTRIVVPQERALLAPNATPVCTFCARARVKFDL